MSLTVRYVYVFLSHTHSLHTNTHTHTHTHNLTHSLTLSLSLTHTVLCLCCVLILSSSEGRDTPLATNSSLHHQLRRPETDGGEEDGEEDDVFRRVGDLWGGALSPDQCRLEWSHEDNVTVGTPSVATLHVREGGREGDR